MSDQGIRILVIDGEGSPAIGVVPSVRVLDEMMSRIAFDDDKSHESVLPCQYFDLIVGSGDGGWIALMLGRLGMSASRTKTVYEEIHTFIHQDCASLDPAAKASAFELRLKSLVCQETGKADPRLEKLQEAKTIRPRCKVAVLTTAALNIGAPILLRTYHIHDDKTENLPIWVAMRACTARPNVFTEIHVSGQSLISASLSHNNPIESAIQEALVAFPKAQVDCIISLGSGHPGHSEFHPASVDSSTRAAMELALRSELVSQEFARGRHTDGRDYSYFRFNVQQGPQAFVQAGYNSALAHTRVYLQDPAVGDSLNNAINILQGGMQVTQPLSTVDNSPSEIFHASDNPPIQTYVYALYEEGFGLPLWDPQPLYRAKPVEIGDVGILTQFGAFEVLFNATLPAALQATMGYRIPPDFEPISVLSSDIELDPEVLQVPFLAHGDVVHSSHGLNRGIKMTQSTQHPITLSFSAMNGAALVIKNRPTEFTLTPKRKIEQYIMKNCRSWYHYYEHDSQGPRRDLRGSSLVFVTSVVQNSEWALGAWSSLTKPIEVSYSGFTTTGDGNFLNISGHWVPPGRRDVKQGPTAARGAPRPRLRKEEDSGDIFTPPTQTLFVRGYVVGVRDTRPEILEPSQVYPLAPKLWVDILKEIFSYGIPAALRAASKPRDLPPPPPPPMAPAVPVDDGPMGEDSVLLETKELTPPCQLRHPVDDIMDNMFKIDPSIDTIVLHEDLIVDLMHRIKSQQVNSPADSLSLSLPVARSSSFQKSRGICVPGKKKAPAMPALNEHAHVISVGSRRSQLLQTSIR